MQLEQTVRFFKDRSPIYAFAYAQLHAAAMINMLESIV